MSTELVRRPIEYSDNVCVKRGRESMEYLAIWFAPFEESYRHYEVALSRYCVPGRCDTYRFDWDRSSRVGHVRFYSEGFYTTLPAALKLLAADLDKPQVVKLLVEAVTPERHMSYSHQLIDKLLAVLAPKSKSYRACKRAYDTMYAARKARFEAARTAAEPPASISE